jgi:alkaline phosphatase D
VVGRFRTALAIMRHQFRLGRRRRTGLGHQPDDGIFTFAAIRSIARIFCCTPATPSVPTDRSRAGDAPRRQGLEECNDREKAKVAETLDEFRAAHKYNFMDERLRAFNAGADLRAMGRP